MFETVRNYTQRESLDLRPGFLDGLAVCKDSGQIYHFRDPTTILFLFNFNPECHALILRFSQSVGKAVRIRLMLALSGRSLLARRLEWPLDRTQFYAFLRVNL